MQACLIRYYVNVDEEVRYGLFVFDIPPLGEGIDERFVKGVGAVVDVQCEKVVDIASEVESLFGIADLLGYIRAREGSMHKTQGLDLLRRNIYG
eukprot:5963098-Pleurochrysis_carterae.AAC.1